MAHPERIRLPASTGGLIRYYDEYKSKLEFKPIYVIIIIVVVIVLELILNASKPLG